ncbi:hypothetical protein GVAV_002659 [Gurleya vavrai]
MDFNYDQKATIVKHEFGDVYTIKLANGKLNRRHASQLKQYLGEGGWKGETKVTNRNESVQIKDDSKSNDDISETD